MSEPTEAQLMTTAELRESTVPAYSPAQRALDDAYIAARDAKNEQKYATALAEWEQIRAPLTLAATPPALALRDLLDLHKPHRFKPGYDVTCEHCFEESYDIEYVEWPCKSYAVIKAGMAP